MTLSFDPTRSQLRGFDMPADLGLELSRLW